MMVYCSMMPVLMGVIMAMPYLTLFERKFLGYMQKRKGPKKVSFQGLLQPVFDGVKLMMKESSFLTYSNFILFWLAPFLNFMLMLFLWVFTPFFFKSYFFSVKLLILVSFTSLNVYTLIGSGWSSNSKYSLLGSVRGATQVISYEVSLMFMILIPSIVSLSYNLWDFYMKPYTIMFFWMGLFLVWLIVMLAETNRAPFDFAEGESELVSGFKTEYSALGFTFLFLGEYGSIIWISLISSVFFLSVSWVNLALFSLVMVYFVVWSRGSLPRFRYDFLMVLAWKIILPFSLFFLGMMFFYF